MFSKGGETRRITQKDETHFNPLPDARPANLYGCYVTGKPVGTLDVLHGAWLRPEPTARDMGSLLVLR